MKRRTLSLHVFKKILLGFIVVFLVSSQITPIHGIDTYPFLGEQGPSENAPSIHGYQAQSIMDWDYKTDPDAKFGRSFVPLQARNEAFSATQANPDLDPSIELFNLSVDYGNNFMDNRPYFDKFALYNFNFWQYTDYFAAWHGTVTPHIPRDLMNQEQATDWTKRTLEFGIMNLPSPSYTDAAHRNGVLSLGKIFQDRGLENYRQMLRQDENGNYIVAEKMVEIAQYFGFDGYFFNQEEAGYRLDTADIPRYEAFLKVFQDAGLYVNWYDSVDKNTGSNTFTRKFADNNMNFLHDAETGETVSNSFFFDYFHLRPETHGGRIIKESQAYIDAYNAEHGTNFDYKKIGFAGLEAGKYRWENNENWFADYDTSIAVLGAEFTHAALSEDMGLGHEQWPEAAHNKNENQWMTNVRERLWWSGPNMDPTNTTERQNLDYSDVYADVSTWNGFAHQIAERSVIKGTTFASNFNTGHGLEYRVDGRLASDKEWSNMSLQSIPVTWQWWQETAGEKLAFDFDYGQSYEQGSRYDYHKVGGYNGGSSLVANGKLTDDNFIRLYKTDLDVNAQTRFEISFQKQHDAQTGLALGLIFKDAPENVEYVDIDTQDVVAGLWFTKTVDLSAYAGREIASFGLKFKALDIPVEDFQMNIGNVLITDGNIKDTVAPANLTINHAYKETSEMEISWDLHSDYDAVQSYNVYINDTYVGGKYDENFFIENLPAHQGTLKVVAVGADGKEGAASTLEFDLNKGGISNESFEHQDNGDLIVTWENTGVSGLVEVSVDSFEVSEDRQVHESVTVDGQANEAQFTGMPLNGDRIKVTITPENDTPISIGGSFTDRIADTYEGEYSWEGETFFLEIPENRDWEYLYFYEDGVARTGKFAGAETLEAFLGRGRSRKLDLNFETSATEIHVVLQDFSGNKSEPLKLERNVSPETILDFVKAHQDVDESLFTTQSYGVFKNALEAAETVAENPHAFQSSYRKALQAAQEAFESLVERANIIELEDLIQKAHTYLSNGKTYTESSLNIFNEALHEAQETLKNLDASQEDVDQIVNKLQAAMEGLEEQIPVDPVIPVEPTNPTEKKPTTETSDTDNLPATGMRIVNTTLGIGLGLVVLGFVIYRYKKHTQLKNEA